MLHTHLESMLTEAECHCAKNCRQPCSQRNAVITVRRTPSQTAPKQTCSNRSTCIHVHHGIQTLPRGTAWHAHRTTRIDVLRRQTTHGHTRTNTRKPTRNGWSGGWSGQNRHYWTIPHVSVFFRKTRMDSMTAFKLSCCEFVYMPTATQNQTMCRRSTPQRRNQNTNAKTTCSLTAHLANLKLQGGGRFKKRSLALYPSSPLLLPLSSLLSPPPKCFLKWYLLCTQHTVHNQQR